MNPTSSSVKMAAALSSFGAVMETMTVRITLMKPTAVSLPAAEVYVSLA